MATVIRIVVIYLLIVAGMRVLGKREFGQLSPLELVTLLLIPELVSQALVGDDFSMTNAVIALSTLFSLVFVSSLVQFHSKKASTVVNGTPAVLVHQGVFYLESLELERVTEDEILAEMHKAGVASLDEVEWAILESDGRIAVVPKTRGAVTARSDEIVQ